MYSFCCAFEEQFSCLQPWNKRVYKDDTNIFDWKIGSQSKREASNNRYWVLATFEHWSTSPGNSSCTHQWERQISSRHHIWATEQALADFSVPGSSKDFTYQEGSPTVFLREFPSFCFCMRLTWKFVLPSKTSENGTMNSTQTPHHLHPRFFPLLARATRLQLSEDLMWLVRKSMNKQG